MFYPILPVKKGDKGQTASEIQKRLSILDYDLIVDGDFGQKSSDAITSFQSKNGLLSDGIVGKKTWGVLSKQTEELIKPTLSNSSDLKIIRDALLPESQYYKQETKKSQIFIHFTAGAPSARNVISGWDANAAHIATAYVIDGNTGSAYECFNPKYWSYHLGIKGTRGKLDRASIGIEICAWGPVTLKDGKYYNYINKELPESTICKLDKPFRGYKYFHAYTDEQILTVEKLLEKLIPEFKINIQPNFEEDWFEFNQDVITNVTPGIWTHTTCRTDKTDSYPDKRILDMLNRLAKKFSKASSVTSNTVL